MTNSIVQPAPGRIVSLLLAAILLMGLGRILLLPAFEGYDETAHYSRIQGEAFAPSGTPDYFMSREVMDYPDHGPMSPRWIFARAFNQSFREALKTGQPMRVMEKFDTLTYTDYHDFFSTPARAVEYRQLYRESAGDPVYTASPSVNWQFQHPPLYYTLMGEALRAIGETPLVIRLLVLRTISYLLAFAGFALGLFATWKHLEYRKHAAAPAIAALFAFYPFVMPMYFEEFSRLGNDSLCALLFSATWALMLWHLRAPREKIAWVLIGFSIGVSCFVKMLMAATGFGFLFFMALYAWRRDAAEAGFAARLAPVGVAGAITLVFLAWCKTVAPTAGSIELSAWLHGQGFVSGDGLAWENMLWNVQNLFTSMIYSLSDLALFHKGTAVIGTFLIALLAVLGGWLTTLKRDPRREEWLPLYVLAPLAGGLLLHAVLGGFAYRPEDVGVTPGRYIHVAAPALMLIFGAGLWRLSHLKAGKTLLVALLSGALLLNIGIMALRLALTTGCLWISDNFSRVHADWGSAACQPGEMYARLALLAFPDAGLACIALSLAALTVAILLTLRRLDPRTVQ